jgi:chorismate mutase/prephenate dehydratase
MFFTVNNEAGSLGKAVSIIGEHGFNLQALKSRPTKDLNWEYYFYVEGRGNIGGENGQIMVSRLSKVCRSVKVAGSFGREIKLSV